jgi:hypothetical protein
MKSLCRKQLEPKLCACRFASAPWRSALTQEGFRHLPALAIFVIALLSGGCASLVGPSDQDILVETLSAQGARMAGAKCLIETKKSAVSFLSGATVNIPRSPAPAKIKCIDSSGHVASGILISRANIGLAGNAVFGGMIGLVVDNASGAGFDYPPQVSLRVGQTREFDRISSLTGVAAPGRLISDDGRSQERSVERERLIKGLAFRVREIDRVSGQPSADITLEITAVSDSRVEFNGGNLVFYSDGRAPSGAPPMPHMSGLGGQKLAVGVASVARFFPGGEAPPVSIKITPREHVLFSASERTTTLLLCDVDGHGVVFGTPGGGGVTASQRIQGYVIVEPTSGLVVAANVRSENKHYSFARDFSLESGTTNKIDNSPATR